MGTSSITGISASEYLTSCFSVKLKPTSKIGGYTILTVHPFQRLATRSQYGVSGPPPSGVGRSVGKKIINKFLN